MKTLYTSEEYIQQLTGVGEEMKFTCRLEIESLSNSLDRRVEKLNTETTIKQHYLNYNMNSILSKREKVTFSEYIQTSLQELRRQEKEFNYHVMKGVQEAQRILGVSSLGITIVTDTGQEING